MEKKQKKKTPYGLIVALLLAFVPRMQMLFVLPRWDAGEYYNGIVNACENFKFSFSYILENFNICGHVSMGYTIFPALFEFIFKKQYIGVNLANLILELISVYFVYKIVQKVTKKESDLYAAICAGLYGIAPMLLGTFAYFHLDYGIMIFFVFLIYAHVYEKNIARVIFGILLCFTKETGIIIFAGYLIGYGVYRFAVTKGSFGEKAKAVLKDKIIWTSLIPVVLLAAYMLYEGGVSWQPVNEEQGVLRWQNDGTNCFGFSVTNILNKIKQIFILNFMWIPTLVIIICTIIKAKKQIASETEKKRECMYLLTGTLIGHVLFSILYITAPLPRYNMISDCILIMLSICLLSDVLSVHLKKKRLIPGIVAVGILFMVEAFFTIDPLTLLTFQVIETGGVPLVKADYPYYGDAIVYNYQYTFLDSAITGVMNEVQYMGNMMIIDADTGEDFFASGNLDFYQINWDFANEERTVSDGFPIREQAVNDYEVWRKEEALTHLALLIFPEYHDYDEEENLARISKTFEAGERKVYHTIYGDLVYYELVHTNYTNTFDPIMEIVNGVGLGEERNAVAIDADNRIMQPFTSRTGTIDCIDIALAEPSNIDMSYEGKQLVMEIIDCETNEVLKSQEINLSDAIINSNNAIGMDTSELQFETEHQYALSVYTRNNQEDNVVVVYLINSNDDEAYEHATYNGEPMNADLMLGVWEYVN